MMNEVRLGHNGFLSLAESRCPSRTSPVFTINGDVTSATSISNSGTINGTPSVGPVDTEALPSLSYSAGGLNKTVPSGGSLALTPEDGPYGIVTINKGGTLRKQ